MKKISAYFLILLLFTGGNMNYEFTPVVEKVASTFTYTTDSNQISFNMPMNVFSGGDGTLYVLDTFNNMIHKIDSYGNTTLFTGNIVMLDEYTPLLDSFQFPMGFHRDGSLENALFNRPVDGVKDAYGRIFIVDHSNHAIRVIDTSVLYNNDLEENRYITSVFTLAGGNGAGYSNGFGLEATFYYPSAIAIDSDGNLYIADAGNNVIRRIDTNGYVTTVAGLGGVFGYRNGNANESLFRHPMGIAVNETGTIFVADTGNHLIRIIEGNAVRTLAGTYTLPFQGLGVGRRIHAIPNYPQGGFGDTGYYNGATFNAPKGLTLWGDVLIVADSLNHAIRAVLPTGEVSTIISARGDVNETLHEPIISVPQGVYVLDNKLLIVNMGNNSILRITWRDTYA